MSESYQKWFKAKQEKLGAIDCYSAGVTPEGLAEQLGVDISKIVKLNFNENLFVDRSKQIPLMKQLAEDEAIAAADTLLLTVPNQLGVDYNAHAINSILQFVAPELGWR